MPSHFTSLFEISDKFQHIYRYFFYNNSCHSIPFCFKDILIGIMFGLGEPSSFLVVGRTLWNELLIQISDYAVWEEA